MRTKPVMSGTLLAILAACTMADGGVEVLWNPRGLASDPQQRKVITFDAAPGNALAVGGNVAVENFILNLLDSGTRDTSFVTFYQAIIGSTSDENGLNTPSGLNNTYQYTTVARLVETVVSATSTPGRGTADFAGIPGDSYFEMYYHALPGGAADNLAGTGFNDGTLVLAASVTALTSSFSIFLDLAGNPTISNLDNSGANSPNDNYPLIDTLQGSGDVQLTAAIHYVNHDFFPTLLLADQIRLSLDFSSNLITPFNQVDPSGAFLVNSTTTAQWQTPVASGAGDHTHPVYGIGTVNAEATAAFGGRGGPSVQEQVDGNFSIERQAAIPEPSAVVMWTLIAAGGLGCSICRRRLLES